MWTLLHLAEYVMYFYVIYLPGNLYLNLLLLGKLDIKRLRETQGNVFRDFVKHKEIFSDKYALFQEFVTSLDELCP